MDKIGNYRFRTMDETSARTIVRWRYPAPYEIYNIHPDQLQETLAWYLDPQNKYFTVSDETDQLFGFRCFGKDAQVPGGDYSADALDMGGGLKPALTGRGLGGGFMQAAITFAQHHYPPTAFRATVAAFNLRALSVCEKVGYRRSSKFISTHSQKPFIILIKEIP